MFQCIHKYKRLFLCVLFILLYVPFQTKAATTLSTNYTGTNANAQNYSCWSKPVNSYLIKTGSNELMRFQSNAISGKYLIEYYDTNYQLKKTIKVNKELNLFGAYYYDGSSHYILSGQNNTEQSKTKEVYRLTKYDKNWTRLSSACLRGANTTYPFEAGCARITHDGNYLFVRTCHKMYKSSDGYNHQANVTIQFNKSTMKLIDSYYDIMNASYGYVSHSFNQFIKVDDGYMVGVDHGDAYPRSIVLCKYKNKYTSTGFKKNCTTKTLLSISGRVGDNNTGVSIGGFEVSHTSYLVAGNAVTMGSNYNASAVRNIFIASVKKDLSGNAVMHKITNYGNGESSPSTPQFVKVADNCFVILWTKDSMLYYCTIDENGNRLSSIQKMNGELSDCQPAVMGNKVIWYVWKNNEITYHSISVVIPATPKATSATTKVSAVKTSVSSTPKKTSISKISNAKGKKISLVWKKVSGVTGYQIQYSKSKTYASGNKTITISKNSTVKKTITKLSKGKTYYVRIRTYKKTSGVIRYSGWCTVKAIKIKK